VKNLAFDTSKVITNSLFCLWRTNQTYVLTFSLQGRKNHLNW